MEYEQRLIDKTYYTGMLGTAALPPGQQLGAMAATCNAEELPYIRFAQGELYFSFGDYEAAIYKWEQVQNHLRPWAQKNMGDAYMELELLRDAEQMYQSIQTKSEALAIEIALQLFELYTQQDRTADAFQVIEQAVRLSPDYPGLTALARHFYEQQEDWHRAVLLAVDELVRTEQELWVQALQQYARSKYTLSWKPAMFAEALAAAYRSNAVLFQDLTAALWDGYRNSSFYKAWLQTIQDVLYSAEVRACRDWTTLLPLFEQTFDELLTGLCTVQELKPLVPVYLENWLFAARQTSCLHRAAAAVVAWSELFPFTLPAKLMEAAQQLLREDADAGEAVLLEQVFCILQQIQDWADRNQFSAKAGLRWQLHYLQKQELHIALAGEASWSALQELLGHRLTADMLSHCTTVCTEHDHTRIQLIEPDAIRDISAAELLEVPGHALVEMTMPSRFLQQHNLSIIASSNWWQEEEKWNSCLSLADCVLFPIDAAAGVSRETAASLRYICTYAGLPVLVLLYGTAAVTEDELARQLQLIQTIVPEELLCMQESRDLKRQIGEAADRLQPDNRQVRSRSLLPVVRKTLYALAEELRERERMMNASIKTNGDLLLSMGEMENELAVCERGQLQALRASLEQIRDAVKRDAKKRLPALLRGCANLLQPDSDFRSVHMMLNEAMNERVQLYITQTAAGKLQMQMQNWIEEQRQRMREQTSILRGLRKTIQNLCGEDCLNLETYIGIFSRWEQEASRLPYEVQAEHINILLRSTPGQLLLKGAGKLLGGRQGNALLYSQYKKYIEGEDYEAVVEQAIAALLQPFEQFARMAEEQLEQYFRDPIGVLKRMNEETHLRLQESRQAYGDMKAKPELYEEPLLLFEVRLRQYEMLCNSYRSRMQAQ
ncbi:tetratricopeptide repeat protein [Ectobacillus ponti]|uniref:GTP-binding protein n=1 Tax=Ectobacillus ponti TaxID=2961894 RepID=A0AA42BRW5_9BACI|nr:hypothetical protein [Ectobacillus ponti]MCP8970766.1 hypothetical protein [Ectobacillus ponti]